MSEYKFSEEAISNAIEAAKGIHHENQLNAAHPDFDLKNGGCIQVSAECISIVTKNHKVCLELPFKLGRHCISVPVNIPDGTAGKACLTICTTWGIPTGVKVSVVIGGITVISQSFGKC